MPVSALSPRVNRHATGPGRGSSGLRRPAESALTVTVAIPLTTDTLSPQAHKLIEAVRELVEMSQGTITVEPASPGPLERDEPPPGPEVRLLTGTRQVLLDGEPLPLTRLEFDLLLFLAENPGRVFTRRELLDVLWRDRISGTRTIDVHVLRLRAKISRSVVTTVRNVGYRFAGDLRAEIVR